MLDLLSGGRLMQTIFFYDLGLIKQWEGVDIDEKMEKKVDVNYRWIVSNQAVISVNSKLFYLINSNDLEYFLASAPHTLDMEEQLKRPGKKRHKDVDNIVVTPKWLLPKYNKRMMHVSLLSCSPFPSCCLAWPHFWSTAMHSREQKHVLISDTPCY